MTVCWRRNYFPSDEILIAQSMQREALDRNDGQARQVMEMLILGRSLAALTGIEGACRQLVTVHLSLSCAKYVQLVSRRKPETRHQRATLSLGCHS